MATTSRIDGSIPVTLTTAVPGQGRYFRCLSCGGTGTAPTHAYWCAMHDRNRTDAA
jgi:hypothetical protein